MYYPKRKAFIKNISRFMATITSKTLQYEIILSLVISDGKLSLATHLTHVHIQNTPPMAI
jgi:hypothetical protein